MDSYVYTIAALLPVAAAMVVFQSNPYQALVLRGVLGAIAALVYAVLGAADVALTEALVGTLLAITLYAVAVRSSLVLRLGIWERDIEVLEEETQFRQILNNLRSLFEQYHMRVEILSLDNRLELERALLERDVHAIWIIDKVSNEGSWESVERIITRVPRIYEILQTGGIVSTLAREIDKVNSLEVRS
jgi:putative multicomponent Na+:H+ antiporter subunit B